MEVLIKDKIKQVLKGNQNAYSYIVEEYKDKVFYLCYRMIGNRHEAEDLAQEAFLKAYVNIKSFNLNMKFSTWIYRIATNLCIDRIRKKKPDYYLDAEIAGTDGLNMYSQLASDTESPENEVESMEMQETIQNEILKLPEKYRSVIILKYIEDLSLKEISDPLDLPVGTVKTRIHRGREALRLQLRHL
ncbi:RNA polymerase sigma-70 factor (ECF subfamily) [Peribacillus deserti]|uniref:RNA polymerase sigma factor n=1 Tax=Peribacillus deserti TaxID=673318 RepID=A0ABS2QNV2_9BACI|nr:RNA polymerase sigma factor SigW [Peribacillus deserti]MBM7694163.1 RNA polymerase sigma-70 factor (ECF subfamily) [Peribacillus deserti]